MFPLTLAYRVWVSSKGTGGWLPTITPPRRRPNKQSHQCLTIAGANAGRAMSRFEFMKQSRCLPHSSPPAVVSSVSLGIKETIPSTPDKEFYRAAVTELNRGCRVVSPAAGRIQESIQPRSLEFQSSLRAGCSSLKVKSMSQSVSNALRVSRHRSKSNACFKPQYQC